MGDLVPASRGPRSAVHRRPAPAVRPRVTDPAVTEPSRPNRRTRIGSYSLCLDDEGRILLARLSALEVDVGAWTMPGGGIEFGEHPDAAAVRELEEETGLDRRDRGRRRDLLARLPRVELRPRRRPPLPRDHLPDADRRRRAPRRDRRHDRHLRLVSPGPSSRSCASSSSPSSGSSSRSRSSRSMRSTIVDRRGGAAESRLPPRPRRRALAAAAPPLRPGPAGRSATATDA